MSADADIVAAQIGRPLRAESAVVSRCPLGLPTVVRVPPLLDDGTPFPTRYWLTCPLAVRRVGRIEGAGGVRIMDERAGADPRFGERLAAAHERYAAERDAALPPGAHPRPSGGVAGSRAGVKCLHAHVADHVAGNDNPVGEAVAAELGVLECTDPCVTPEGPNPAWREPR